MRETHPQHNYEHSQQKSFHQLLPSKFNTPDKLERSKLVKTHKKKQSSPKRYMRKLNRDKGNDNMNLSHITYKRHEQINTKASIDPVQAQLQRKNENFLVISRTLDQFFKLGENKQMQAHKKLAMTLKMINAFNISDIKPTSKAANSLINNMIYSIESKIPQEKQKKSQKPKKHKQKIRNSYQQSKNAQHNKQGHQFAHKQQKMPKIKQQLQQLANKLDQLEQEGQILGSISCEFEGLTKQQKKQCIKSLQQIIHQQKKILKKQEAALI